MVSKGGCHAKQRNYQTALGDLFRHLYERLHHARRNGVAEGHRERFAGTVFYRGLHCLKLSGSCLLLQSDSPDRPLSTVTTASEMKIRIILLLLVYGLTVLL